METLRFLLVTSFYPPFHIGGDAVHVRYLAQLLAGRGHEVHVEFAPAAYALKRGKVAMRGRETDDSVHVHPIRSPYGRLQPAAAYLAGRSKRITRDHSRLLKECRPDIIHFHNISLLGLGVIHRSPGARTLYTAHDYWLRCPRSDLFKYGRYPCDRPTCLRCSLVSLRPPQLWRYQESWTGLRGIDCAIAPSRFMKDAIERHLVCPVVHLPNFAPDLNPRGSLGEPGDFYLYVGTLERHKGLLELVSAVSGGPRGISIAIAGRGSLGAVLGRLIEGGGAKIEMKGWLNPTELMDLYRGARAVMLPSLSYENSPLAAIEALSYGTPLLVSRRGGLEELIYDGLSGRSFEPRPDDIREAVNQFEAQDLHRSLRKGARDAYAAHHHPTHYLSAYESLVKNLESDRGSAPTKLDAKLDRNLIGLGHEPKR